MNSMVKGRLFPWYDGYWLEYFVRAKAFIEANQPQRLAEFLAALAPLRTPLSFEPKHLKNAVSAETLTQLREVIRTLKPTQLELHEIKTFGRWVVHDHPIMNELQANMTSLAEEASGEALESSYNFLSMYTKLGRCPVHMDAPWAKWTLDICIDQSEKWPIHFSKIVPWPENLEFEDADWDQRIRNDASNEFASHVMEPGDAIIFSGSSQWHFRDPIATNNSNNFCHLIFFHFIPQGMQRWMHPADWESLFDVPGLAQALGHPTKEEMGSENISP